MRSEINKASGERVYFTGSAYRARRAASGPRVHHCQQREIRNIASDQRETMNLGNRGKESVHGADWTPQSLAARHGLSPSLGDVLIHGKNSAFKAERQFISQPLLETVAPRSWRHAVHTITQLCNRNHAEKDSILV